MTAKCQDGNFHEVVPPSGELLGLTRAYKLSCPGGAMQQPGQIGSSGSVHLDPDFRFRFIRSQVPLKYIGPLLHLAEVEDPVRYLRTRLLHKYSAST